MRESRHCEIRNDRIWEIAKRIKVFVFDIHGVFFPNFTTEGLSEGLQAIGRKVGLSEEELQLLGKPQTRSYYDGQGISNLRAIGIKVCFVTNEKGADAAGITAVTKKLNGLRSSKSESNPHGWEHIALYTGHGGAKKIVAAEDFMSRFGASYDECAFMCDDLVDWDLAQKVALLAAPITAELFIRNRADVVSRRPAGAGALRDVTNFILEARGIDPTSLAPN